MRFRNTSISGRHWQASKNLIGRPGYGGRYIAGRERAQFNSESNRQPQSDCHSSNQQHLMGDTQKHTSLRPPLSSSVISWSSLPRNTFACFAIFVPAAILACLLLWLLPAVGSPELLTSLLGGSPSRGLAAVPLRTGSIEEEDQVLRLSSASGTSRMSRAVQRTSFCWQTSHISLA